MSAGIVCVKLRVNIYKKFTKKLWVCASPFKGIIKKNFHEFVNPIRFQGEVIIHYSLFIIHC